MRSKVPLIEQTEVLTMSRRRCCLCFGLSNDSTEKHGQIAHLDRNRGNKTSNLVWLCLFHHDTYDSKTSQRKGLTKGEIRKFRNDLYAHVEKHFSDKINTSDADVEAEEDNSLILDVIHRYSYSEPEHQSVITAEINSRILAIYSFKILLEKEYRLQDRLKFSDGYLEHSIEELKKSLNLQDGIWGLYDERLPESWRSKAVQLARGWVKGKLSYNECTDVLWIFDEKYDLDMHYMLYGFPNASLSGLELRLLTSFVYQFGQRNLGE